MINEWLANSRPGESDWIELHNTSVALRGLAIGTSNQLFQLTALSFLGPQEQLVLFADENSGANHLDLKLSASGDTIQLLDPLGALIDSVTFGPQLEDVSSGRLPDGGATFATFPGSGTPGGNNALPDTSGPHLSEILAVNRRTSVDHAGNAVDWIEIANPRPAAIALDGMRLSLGEFNPSQWTFPAGTVIPAAGRLIVWCDSARTASTAWEMDLNTGRSLSAEGDAVYLFNAAGRLIDAVRFGFQVPDLSIGLSAGQWRLLAQPTPGAANSAPARLGSPAALRFNEWMADPTSGSDWIELFNGDADPVQLSGLSMTDDPSIAGRGKFVVSPLSFIGGRLCVNWIADGQSGAGLDHVKFSLRASGESLRLHDALMALIDGIDFPTQQRDVSQGRLPDGSGRIENFPQNSTPCRVNYVPLSDVFINEVLTSAPVPGDNAIELYNPTANTVAIGG